MHNKELERELADTRLLLHKSQAALKISTIETDTLDVSRFPGKSVNANALQSTNNDPLFERYAKITSNQGKTQHSKIPLPSQFEELSNSSISPLRQTSISFREEFLTPQELALLKKGKIPPEYDNPVITSTPPKIYEKSILSDSSLSPTRNERKHSPRTSNTMFIKSNIEDGHAKNNADITLPSLSTIIKVVGVAEKETDTKVVTTVHEHEKELKLLAAERNESELKRKQVEQDLQKQFEKEQDLLKKERDQKEEMEKQERNEAEKINEAQERIEAEKIKEAQERIEAEKIKEAQERERMRIVEIDRLREEEQKELEKLEKERLKKEEEMKKISALENDPLLQKYMSIVKDKKANVIFQFLFHNF